MKKSFEDEIVQVATEPKSIAIVASAFERDITSMAPIARYAVEIVKQDVEESVEDMVFTALTPPP